MNDRITELEAELSKVRGELAQFQTRPLAISRKRWKAEAEAKDAEIARLRQALKDILAYGQALQPSPVHPVTFNACVIAESALSDKKGAV